MRGIKLRTVVKVVAFVLASAVFTIGLAMKIGNLQLFSHTYGLSAVFSDASGVFKGDDVKLAGVDVGRVTGAEIENGKAVVHFDVDKDVKLTTDSIVAIRWRNVLGLRFLYLYSGTGSGRELHAGDVVPITHTQDAGDIGQFLNELGPILQAINPDQANAFLDSVNQALGGSQVAIRALLDNAAVLSSSLGSKDQQIGALVQNSAKVMAAYAGQSQNLGAILDDLDTLGGKLAGINGQIDSLITNFAHVQQELDQILVRNRGNIDATLSGLQSVTGTLASNRRKLGQALCSLPTGLAPYEDTSSWGQWFNVRVTQVVFKDQSGRQIATGKELPPERASGRQSVVTCGAAPALQGTAGGSQTALGRAAPGAATEQGATGPGSTTSSGDSLSSFLDFVTSKGKG
jgi:phospholipid/cholesterol/gamma-HCH transport system substrate-binding protein